MTKKKMKAIFTISVATLICLIIGTVFTGLVVLTFPLLIILASIVFGWFLKVIVEYLVKNIDYNKLKDGTQKIIEKTKVKEGIGKVRDSIKDLRDNSE